MGTARQNYEDIARKDFNNRVLSIVHHLHPYVKQRLYIAESVGVLRKNLFSSNDIVNECIIKLHDQNYHIDAEAQDLKLELFKIVDLYLDELFEKESVHKKTISTNMLLKEELDQLQESYTIDADQDYMMLEQLDDISYHQNDEDYEIFVFDDHNSKILNVMDLEAESQLKTRQLVGKFYHWLPYRVANIVDLYTFGKLNFYEISKVKQIQAGRVEKILKEVKKRFRANVG